MRNISRGDVKMYRDAEVTILPMILFKYSDST